MRYVRRIIMPDYKSMIKGTINALGTKAKDFAESGKVKEAYDRGSTTARCYAVIAKLNVKINGEVEEQKKIFTEIGHLYYDANKDSAEGKFEILFKEVEESEKRIDEMREELEAAKAAIEASKDPAILLDSPFVDNDT